MQRHGRRNLKYYTEIAFPNTPTGNQRDDHLLYRSALESDAPAAAIVQATLDEAQIEQSAKRKKVHLAEEVVAFDFAYCNLIKTFRSWFAARALRTIWECAPERYGDVHVRTLARWKRPGMDATL